MSVTDQLETFLSITGSTDHEVARNFLEMSNLNLEAAISLFFEHGASIGQTTTTNNDIQSNDIQPDITTLEQSELPGHGFLESETRAPIEPVHERLVGQEFSGLGGFGGFGPDPFGGFPLQSTGGMDNMFGGGRTGVFDQSTYYNSNSSGTHNVEEESDSDSDSDLEEVDGDGEPIKGPPSDIIDNLDLETAKAKAKRSKKWILINIQDDSNQQCQVLNRDFWSSLTIKGLVRREFVFLQYHKDSRSGGQYTQFYDVSGYPHIAILDPITGERVKSWTGVPIVKNWYREVEDFLTKFSLDKNSINPIIPPTTQGNENLTEEQQLEHAIYQSLSTKQPTVDLSHTGDIDDPIEIDDDTDIVSLKDIEQQQQQQQVGELTEEDQLKAIEPIEHPEPTVNSSLITRVQIRTPDGKRIVRKFNIEDKVLVIYQFVKSSVEKAKEGVFFTLTSQRENIFTKLDETIDEAGLKNASILLEFLDDE